MADLFDILLAKNLAGGVQPQGEIEITENGEYDVTEYASASVNVPNKIGKATITFGLKIFANANLEPLAELTRG